MAKFLVTVDKTLACRGTIEIEAKNEREALNEIRDKLNSNEILTTDVSWEEPEYVDNSLRCYGEVQEI